MAQSSQKVTNQVNPAPKIHSHGLTEAYEELVIMLNYPPLFQHVQNIEDFEKILARLSVFNVQIVKTCRQHLF